MRERLGDRKIGHFDPFDSVIADDEAQRLHQVLHRIDSRHRAVLVLHYLQGLSYREMSVVLDEPTGTTKWRTREALNCLRDLLNDEVPVHAPRTTPESGSAH
jgi:DNA-directed RNA polymerase specialized sigma24 family protein